MTRLRPSTRHRDSESNNDLDYDPIVDDDDSASASNESIDSKIDSPGPFQPKNKHGSTRASTKRKRDETSPPPPSDTQETLDCITLYLSPEERRRLDLDLIPESPPKRLKRIVHTNNLPSGQSTEVSTSTQPTEDSALTQSTGSRDFTQSTEAFVSTQSTDKFASTESTGNRDSIQFTEASASTQPDQSFPSAQPRHRLRCESPETDCYTQLPAIFYDQRKQSVRHGQDANVAMDDGMDGTVDDDAVSDGDLEMEHGDVVMEESDFTMQGNSAHVLQTVIDWIQCQDSQAVLQDQLKPNSDGCAAHLGATYYTQQDLVEEEARALAANVKANPHEVISEADLGWNFLRCQGQDSESDPTPHDGSCIQTAHQTKALEYERLFDLSLVTLLTRVLFEECQITKDFRNLDVDELLYDIMLPVLASTDSTILRHIINGNLARAYTRDKRVRSLLHGMRQKSNTQPVIYMQLLVDTRGLSPSPEYLTQVISQMRLYCGKQREPEDIKRLVTIETRFNTGSARWGKKEDVVAGKLKYLISCSKKYSGNPSVCSNHVANILSFAGNLERRLKAYKGTPKWTVPLDVPLVEIGYTSAAKERLAAHRTHDASSNYIMNLMEAICQTLWRDKFKMAQFVIFRIFEPPQAAAAEMVFTRLAQGYINDGGGFSHALAGRSNNSALVKMHQWNDYMKDAVKHTSLLQAMKREVSITKRYTDDLYWKDVHKVRREAPQQPSRADRPYAAGGGQPVGRVSLPKGIAYKKVWDKIDMALADIGSLRL